MSSARLTNAGTTPGFRPAAESPRLAEDATMGRTVVTAKLENLDDLFGVE
jgi:hypothetical protein